MNDELRNRIVHIFEAVEGGSTLTYDNMIDEAIEDGVITQEEFDANEQEIENIFDNGWFTCNQCGWTMPIDEMAREVPEGNDEWICRECAEENAG